MLKKLNKKLMVILLIILVVISSFLTSDYIITPQNIAFLKGYLSVNNEYKNLAPANQIPELNSSSEIKCYQSNEYFVIEKGRKDIVGSDFLLRRKGSEQQTFDCVYFSKEGDFEIKNEEAAYFLALEKDFLFLDSGTGPDRSFVIYDLKSQKRVYEDFGVSDLIIKNGVVDYWRTSDIVATDEKCPNFEKEKSDGFSVVIESHAKLNLPDLSRKNLGEYRCGVRQ